ncbi:lytic transglycosylase domain-containing protein [Natronoflexus pectinivorans]|uniref:Membrane-bound lytic murein transglycosylase D n=1 Tax=Natronoflexus pectinivorans TaxID=682526 RepID=A0A4R2GN97_9BACT|nr:lytic transglycosylase domain-containing protein [Natronoflexus pectinivorans]TCO10772.1 membrane-bound lytic murein transglycosylase D [Natronoflexus pectinivorans]
MKINILITLFTLGMTTGLYASTSSSNVKTTDAEREAFVTSLDSMVNLWHVRSATSLDMVLDTIIKSREMLVDEIPDSVYIHRLADINSPIYYPFNSQVKAYIQLYTQRRRTQMENMLGLSEHYFPIFEAALDARNLPLELKYLPVVESALNPRALSRAGASGIWQFMYHTGRHYGLNVNSYIDERRDPVKASEAAADFLSDLYEIYGDWHLVLAAYNCGPGNVNRAIRRSGGQRDFWAIYYRLPRETRGYVPAFIAATYAFKYAEEHNLHARPVNFPVATDTVMISQPLHFEQISEMTNIPIEFIRELNPQYRRDVIPAQNALYPLRLAFDQTTMFASIEDTIYAHRRDEFFPNNQLVISPSSTTHAVVAPAGTVPIEYTVKSGDVVGLIAEWFNVRASDLRYWNNINRNIIRVGQRLTIYVPASRADHFRAVAARHMGQPVQAAAATPAPATASVGDDGNYVWYTVRSGDNLWTIARQYPGVSNEDIMRLNNITDAGRIRPGQRLRIKPAI